MEELYPWVKKYMKREDNGEDIWWCSSQ